MGGTNLEMIKGKFVAMIDMDIAIDENRPGLYPFDRLKTAVHEELCAKLQEMMDNEFEEIGVVKVTQQFADLWKEGLSSDH